MDICPTILDLAGIKHPAANGDSGRFRDRDVAPMRGKSWVCLSHIDKHAYLLTTVPLANRSLI
jgi:hypothetical protein